MLRQHVYIQHLLETITYYLRTKINETYLQKKNVKKVHSKKPRNQFCDLRNKVNKSPGAVNIISSKTVATVAQQSLRPEIANGS